MIQDESKSVLVGITKVCFWTLVIFSLPAMAQMVQGDISRVGDATHLEFKGLSQWNYELDKGAGNKVILTMPAFDKKTEVSLRTWADQFIEGIEIKKNGSDGRYKVEFRLSDASVENFDYLTDTPSRLIIDFFKQVSPPEETVAVGEKASNSAVKARKKISGGVKKTKTRKGEYTKYERLNEGERTPAGELDPRYDHFEAKNTKKREFPQRGAFDGGDPDFTRFRMKDYEIKEDSIIASRQNFYIRFPMLKMPTSQLPLFLENKPEYVIKEKDSRENKEARLLLQLYKKGRFALFFKTYRYFKDKYPDSKYNEIIHHLAAEIHFNRYIKDGNLKAYRQARDIYTKLLKDYPDSPLSERTDLILAYAELERGNGIETLQKFQAFLEKYPKTEHRDQARKSMAAGYLTLNKYKDALKTYTDLSRASVDRAQRIELCRGGSYRSQ